MTDTRRDSIWLILTALAVIAILVDVWIAIESAGHSKSPRWVTRQHLMSLNLVVFEFEARTGEVPPGSFESPEASINAFLNTVNREPHVQSMVMNLGLDFLEMNPTGEVIGINDAWGRSIWYVPYSDGQSIHLPRRGTAKTPQPFFISRGEDGEWGNYIDGKPDDEASDNIVSFEDR